MLSAEATRRPQPVLARAPEPRPLAAVVARLLPFPLSPRTVRLDYRPALSPGSPSISTHRGMGVTGTFDSTQVLRPFPRHSGVERGVRNVSLVNVEKIAKGLKTALPEPFRRV